MVKEEWINRRVTYLSNEGKTFARYFLLASICTLCLAVIMSSTCGIILAVVMAASSVLARVISFLAGYFVKTIATILFPRLYSPSLVEAINLPQESISIVAFTPLPGVPRSILPI